MNVDHHLPQHRSRLRRAAPIVIPLFAVAAWFGYVHFVSRVLPIEAEYSDGAVKVQGRAMRSGLGEYQRHGPWVEFHPNGRKAVEGNYRMGRKIGAWREWDEFGRLTREHDYGEAGEAGEADEAGEAQAKR